MPSFTEAGAEWPDLEPVAVVGMACRLPGSVDSPAKFWELLKDQRSVRTPKVPRNRFDIDAHYHPDLSRPGSFPVLGGYFLDNNLEDFDSAFFGMTPVEAMWLDPQQRAMLEVAYECFESAGLPLEAVAGSNTGVFIGSFTSDYQQMSTVERDFRHNYAATGVDVGIISNRINNAFNLSGPSFTINTACSSSVYAIHNACHALRTGDCEAAIAGGVNLILTVDQHMNTAKLGVLSPTSECHTFDASADGYGRAEGAGALYLKRLSDAIRDNDVIRGVIRSSAVNTNGKVPGMGITFPNVTGQERVVRKAYERAGLDPNQTAYLECHGTGTPAGDPIEVRAVANAMNDTRSTEEPLILGAVKANIGHSEAASGIFAAMKAALMTEKALIPGVHGFQNLNPNINDKELNVKIAPSLMSWPSSFDLRRASVSSFGYGGTNAHLIIESIQNLCPWYGHGQPRSVAQYRYDTTDTEKPFIVTFSAHDSVTLRRNIENYESIANSYHLPDLAYTLNCRRSRFAERAYTITTPGSDRLDFSFGQFTVGAKLETPVKIGFVFTGQGAQWARMGYEAMQCYPEFAKTIDSLDCVLQQAHPQMDWTLRQALEAPAEISRIAEAEISQPVCTAIQIAIVDLFASWGIEPLLTVGHSSGEIAAAYASGRTSAPQAILAAFFRGYAVKQSAPQGTMLAVALSAAEIMDLFPTAIPQKVAIACENSNKSVTLSGSSEDILSMKSELDESKIFARELRTGKAYHSPHMDTVAPLYHRLYSDAEECLTEVDLAWRRPTVAMVSSVTGSTISTRELPISYWCDNLRNRVKFNQAIHTVVSQHDHINSLVEIGPHAVLGGSIKQICAALNVENLSYTPSLIRGSDSRIALLKTAGELFLKGADVNFEIINAPKSLAPSTLAMTQLKTQRSARFIPDLPPYDWNHDQTQWYEPRAVKETRGAKYERHDILGRRISGLSSSSSTWKNVLRQRDVPWFQDHRLGSDVVYPAAGYFSMAAEAVLQKTGLDSMNVNGVDFRDISIEKALLVPDTDDGIETHTRLQDPVDGWMSFTVESLENDLWTVHCKGQIRCSLDTQPGLQHSHDCPSEANQLHQQVRGSRWYQSFERVGFHYGPHMQTMKDVRANGKDRIAAADVLIQTTCGAMVQESRYMLHPSTIDGCLHAVIASVHKGLHKEMGWGIVPVEIEEMSLTFPEHDNNTEGRCITWTDQHTDRHFYQNLELTGPSGTRLFSFRNMKLVIYDSAIPAALLAKHDTQPYRQIMWEPAGFLEAGETEGENGETAVLCATDQLESSLELSAALGATCSTIQDAAVGQYSRIVVNDIGSRLLANVCTDNFDAIKRILCSGKSIIWLTYGANSGACVSAGIPQGFLRAIRSELAASRIVLIDMDLEVPIVEVCAAVEDQFFQDTSKDPQRDVEFWLRADGSLNVPRILPSVTANKSIHGSREFDLESLRQDVTYRGSITDGELGFTWALTSEGIAPHEVEVTVRYIEFSRDDLKQPKATPRVFVGEVSRVGANLDPSLAGQYVVSITDRALETKICTAVFVPIRPENAQTTVAALGPLCKASLALLRLGEVKSCDKVLVVTPDDLFAGAVDALAKDLGFSVIHAKDDVENLPNLIRTMRPSLVVVSHTSSIVAHQAWRCLGRESRLVVNDVHLDTALDARPFIRGAKLAVCSLLETFQHKQNEFCKLIKETVSLLAKQNLPALPKSLVTVDVEELLDLDKVRASLGSTQAAILGYRYSESQIKSRPERKELRLNSQSAYVLVGCLGGLGRSLTTWMLDHGCKDFVFLSRSGATKPEAAGVVAHLEQAGAKVEVCSVDATNEEVVADVIKRVGLTRPIRGVIHAAMVLQDGLFENMTAEKYNAALCPKMYCAIALHKALGDMPLDFFIMTSSVSAVLGNPGQANYCAGNSYLDYLAVHRRKKGLAACSIALPMVEDVGVVAENASIAELLTRKNPFSINEQEMLRGFEAAILHGSPTAASEEMEIGQAQLILGLEPESVATVMRSTDMSEAYWMRDTRISSLREAIDGLLSDHGNAGQTQASGVSNIMSDLAGRPENELIAALAQHIINRTARILGYPAEKFKADGASVASHGVDSMIGVELQTWLYKELGLQLSVQVLSNPQTTFITLANMVAENAKLIDKK